MKNVLSTLRIFTLILLLAALNGCVKDKLTTTYTLFKPVYKSKTEVLQSIKSSPSQPLLQTGKLFKYGNYIFVNEVNKGVHIIDNTNPAAPVNKYFISIPGSLDMAVKDNILYADIFTDLVVIDISNPQQAELKKMIPNIFPERQYQNGFVADSTKYIIDWIKYKTVVVRNNDSMAGMEFSRDGIFFSSSNMASQSSGFTKAIGISGSMARFTIVNEYLYTVGTASLTAVNISIANNPVIQSVKSLGWNIETIYPLKDKLFIGGQNGMFIYDISNPADPAFSGSFSHACFRDPVIADDKYAYVTLRSLGEQGVCRGGLAAQRNELDIVDIQNIAAPALLKVYDMAEPKGLSKDGNLLFICDGKEGLKLYDATDVQHLKLINTVLSINPADVILQDKIALVVAVEGIFQYDYSNVSDIKLVSKILVNNN